MNQLLLYWFMFVGGGALVGAFVGTVLALASRGACIKIKRWVNK